MHPDPDRSVAPHAEVPSGGAAETAPSRRGSAVEVLGVTLRLGLTSFGGPIAHIGYFRREYVERRRWLDEARFADLVALSQLLPGPASSQLGIAIGTRRAGIAGGIAAWIGFTLPSAIAMILFGLFAGGADLATMGWVHGLKIAAVVIVAQAVWAMARALAPDWPRRALAVTATIVALTWTSELSQIAIIFGGGAIGWLVLSAPTSRPAVPDRSPIPREAGIAALALFFTLLLGLPLLDGPGHQPISVVAAFFRAGALVFGGGHVVLPLLHASVVDRGWVPNDAFLAGYGAAQAVPGPLFTFAGYLGTVSTPSPNGVAGGILALAAIFLPSFLLIFGTLPFWERLRELIAFRRALAGTSAAVVGLLLATLITPVWTSAVGAPADVAAVAIGLALVATGRVPPIAIVAVLAGIGQVLGPG